MSRTVLVGTDGSPTASRAVVAAAALTSNGDTLVIVSAYRPMPESMQLVAADLLGSEAYLVTGSYPTTETLQRAGDMARLTTDAQIRTEAFEGDPVQALVQAAREHAADLVVVGDRGMHSLTGRVFGSIARSVTRQAPCDVVVVRTSDKAGEPIARAA